MTARRTNPGVQLTAPMTQGRRTGVRWPAAAWSSRKVASACFCRKLAAMASVKMTVPLIMCILPSLFAVVIGPAIAMVANRMTGM